ncbi:MAG TPA: hypothetical protein VMI56_25955 [Reyranella sp.]|nr:hypothetical protein [Reyranella sp.]
MTPKMLAMDAIMIASAFAVTFGTWEQHTRPMVARWKLLLPPVCAVIATLALVGYPDPRDLMDLQRWTAAVAGLLVGVARGALLSLAHDKAHDTVRLRRAGDGFWLAIVLLVFVLVHAVIEVTLGTESPVEDLVEMVMLLSTGFLLGRGVTAWLRTGAAEHTDLYE